MAVDYGKRVIDRRRANTAARPKAVESREARLEKQVKILADRFALTLMVLVDARAVVAPPNIFATMTYLEDAANELLNMELTPSVGLKRKFDHKRDTELYNTLMSSVRHLVRNQYQEDKFQP